MRSLGRLQEFDEKSRNYPVRMLLGDVPALFTKIWDCDVWLDQGTEGACVGFSWAHELSAEPSVYHVGETGAQLIYREAQQIDEWPGEDYEGTSVLAGVKIVKSLGFIEEYRWGFSLSDVLDAVVNIGPVVLGTNWYEGMWNTDQDGYIWPTGSLQGGHAIAIIGYDHERGAVLLHNSWGQSWGVDGRAWVSVPSLEFLLDNQGEACIPVVRKSEEPEVVDVDVIDVDVEVIEPEVVVPDPGNEFSDEPEAPNFFEWLFNLIASWFR
jgi:hypothetical protein